MTHSLCGKTAKAGFFSALLPLLAFSFFLSISSIQSFVHYYPANGNAAAAVVSITAPAVPADTVLPAKKAVKDVPAAHIRIPSIGVDAVIKEMGLTPEGAMAVPGNNYDAGWYDLGTRPGNAGSAVIGGHNRWADAPGVFSRLNELKQGDIVSVVDAEGAKTSFVVREMRTFDATDINSGIFKSETGAHLNLVTCSGVWDPTARTYSQRLVVFTDAIPVPLLAMPGAFL